MVDGATLSMAPCAENTGRWFYRIDYSLPNRKRPSERPATGLAVVLLDRTVLLATPVVETSAPQTVGQKNALDINPAYPREYYDGSLATNTLGSQATMLLLKDNFRLLDSEFERLQRAGQRLPDGRSQYVAAIVGLSEVVAIDENWDKAFEKLQRWREAMPGSSNAVIAEAMGWYEYAWYARGHGFSSTVSSKAWELFRQRLARSRRVLEDSKNVAGSNPYWYTAMLNIATMEDWPLAKQRGIFDEAIRRDPGFIPHYFAMGSRLTPRWGGSIEQFRELTELAVDRTGPTEGKSMYARMYWIYADTESDRAFRDLGIPWPLMRSGFEDLIARYPSPWNVNNYARFACEADDKPTFLKLLPRLSPDVLRSDAWPSGYKFETCKETFTTRT